MRDRVCHLIKMKPPIADRGFLFASGASKPTDGTDGFQAACLFQDTTNGIMYVNEGSITSADFNALGDLTSVDYSEGGTTAITISGTYTSDGILMTGPNINVGLRIGTFVTGAATTNGVPFATTQNIYSDGQLSTMEVHGATSSDLGSGSSAKCGRFRHVVNVSGNVNAETYGLMGQLVTRNATLLHWHAGVIGTYECHTSHTVNTGNNGAAAVIGRVGGSGITISSGANLAAVIALASAASVSATGKYMGLYVTKTSGASNFDYGAYIENSDIGIAFAGTMTTGIDFTGTTLAPDSSRTNSAIALGDRLGAKTITFTSGTDHLDPIQINLLTAGVNPASGSTLNSIYQLITHSTDMANLRLKCADWNIAVSKNVKDVYCYQGEVLFSGSGVTVGGEAAVLGLVMNAGSSAVTGKLRGLIISMQGSGFPADGIGIELRSTATTLAEGIRISGTPQTTIGIAMGNQANDNEGPVNAFFFPTGPSADQGPVRNTAEAGTGAGSILIKIGGTTKYLQFWDNPS